MDSSCSNLRVTVTPEILLRAYSNRTLSHTRIRCLQRNLLIHVRALIWIDWENCDFLDGALILSMYLLWFWARIDLRAQPPSR